ncbi:hypothetical protein RJ641_017815 [Dillenia turbinata]|uniref:Uncharacterized protein n=1 Tax=Dillenia turbinata TaxID=194707 RepID=A0AAN8UMX0_9MAGN
MCHLLLLELLRWAASHSLRTKGIMPRREMSIISLCMEILFVKQLEEWWR